MLKINYYTTSFYHRSNSVEQRYHHDRVYDEIQLQFIIACVGFNLVPLLWQHNHYLSISATFLSDFAEMLRHEITHITNLSVFLYLFNWLIIMGSLWYPFRFYFTVNRFKNGGGEPFFSSIYTLNSIIIKSELLLSAVPCRCRHSGSSAS